MLSYLQTANVLIGLIGTLAGALVGIVLFVHRRMRSVAQEVAAEAKPAQATTAARLDLVDADVGRLRVQVAKVSEDVGRLTDRLGGVERVMETVARSSDVAALRVDLAKFMGSTGAQLEALTGLMDTLYQAALRSGPAPRSGQD